MCSKPEGVEGPYRDIERVILFSWHLLMPVFEVVAQMWSGDNKSDRSNNIGV